MCYKEYKKESFEQRDYIYLGGGFLCNICLHKLPRHCGLLRTQQFLNCLSIYCHSFLASILLCSQDTKEKSVQYAFTYDFCDRSINSHSIAFSRKLLSCGHFVNFFPGVNQSRAKRMTEEALITYCCCTIH